MENRLDHSAVCAAKNRYLELGQKAYSYRQLSPVEFIDTIFSSCDHKDPQCPIYPFERQMCEEYIKWRAQVDPNKHRGRKKKKAKYDPAQPFRYNALIQAVYQVDPDPKRDNDSGRRSKTWVIVGDAESDGWDAKVCGWDNLDGLFAAYDFVIMTPATFVGRRRFKRNARYLYALAFDLDEVGVGELGEVIHQQTIGMTPMANIIVNSGDGLHLYYILKKPVPLYPGTYATMNKIKRVLTRIIWNKASSRTGDFNQVQVQPIIQPFRVPGSKTKHGDIVTAWLNEDAPPHTVEELNKYATKSRIKVFNSGVSLAEARAIDAGNYTTNRLTKKRAKALYPEWYQERIVKGKPRKYWHLNRAVYDWWKETLWQSENVAVGHRYHCLMFLSAYARKCGVSQEELRDDVLALVPRMEALTGDTGRHFTNQDALDALKAYKDSSCTFPVKTISDRSGIPIERCRRNGMKQKDHLEEARAVRDVRMKRAGRKDWINRNGRPKGSVITADRSPEYAKVQAWRAAHPNCTNKSQCAREIGLTRPTIYRWWKKV